MNPAVFPSESRRSDQTLTLPLTQDVVEFALLLPKKRAEALLEWSRERHSSVGQILRDLIDEALNQRVRVRELPATPPPVALKTTC
jgi:hypothetical protein